MKHRFVFVLLLAFSCEEPISFDLRPLELVVIDARVSTQPDASYVKVYRAFNEDVTRTERLSGYDIRFLSNAGEEYLLTEGEVRGTYYAPAGFAGSEGSAYRMEAVSPEGHHFTSPYDTILNAVDFELIVTDSLEFEFIEQTNSFLERPAKFAIVEMRPDRQTFQSRFTLHHEFIHLFTEDTVVATLDDEFFLFECYDAASCADLRTLKVGSLLERVWTFTIPGCTRSPDCTIEVEDYPTELIVTQETLTNESYQFWENVDRLLDTNGLIFDSFPFKLEGNISCENCPFDVAGQFSALSETRRSETVIL